MRAIILAAGIGSRLNPITYRKPKTLVEVNGIPMLGHILMALKRAGVDQVVICTGYREAQIKEYVHQHADDLDVEYVHNPDYEQTNNMYSLYLARKYLSGDTFIMNGDLVFDSDILSGMYAGSTSLVAVDRGRYLSEAMKIIVNNKRVRHISKTIAENEAFGSSIDVYLMRAETAKLLVTILEDYVEKQGELKLWTEVALDTLFTKSEADVYPYEIGKNRWYEIDTYDDLLAAELVFNSHVHTLKHKKLVLFDRDGTLTLSSNAIPGADELLTLLRNRNIGFRVMTNNSSKTKALHTAALGDAGLSVREDEVLVSLDAAVDHLASLGKTRIYWLANSAVSRYLRERGFHKTKKNPQALLLTWDTEVRYSDLCEACRVAEQEIPYYATHPDMVCPTSNGPIPDLGTYISLIKQTVGREPDLIFGKPRKAFTSQTISTLGLREKDVVIVGDRLYTDMALGNNSDMTRVLVLTGETDRTMLEFSEQEVDIVVGSVADLVAYF